MSLSVAGSKRIEAVLGAMSPFLSFFQDPVVTARMGDPAVSDFVAGNPQEMPLPEFSEALQRWSAPHNKDWFAYKMSEPGPRRLVADTLRQRFAMPFDAEDIFMTNGAFAAIAVALGAITDPGDEIIYISPPWFFYEAMIVVQHGHAGARALRSGHLRSRPGRDRGSDHAADTRDHCQLAQQSHRQDLPAGHAGGAG